MLTEEWGKLLSQKVGGGGFNAKSHIKKKKEKQKKRDELITMHHLFKIIPILFDRSSRQLEAVGRLVTMTTDTNLLIWHGEENSTDWLLSRIHCCQPLIPKGVVYTSALSPPLLSPSDSVASQ